MHLQVLGTGCSKCEKLATAVAAAARELNIDFQLDKVTDINKIVASGVMMTPALVIDGSVKVVGKVPTSDELKSLLAAAASA